MKKKDTKEKVNVIKENLLELDFSNFTEEEEKEARDIIINFGKYLKESSDYEPSR